MEAKLAILNIFELAKVLRSIDPMIPLIKVLMVIGDWLLIIKIE